MGLTSLVPWWGRLLFLALFGLACAAGGGVLVYRIEQLRIEKTLAEFQSFKDRTANIGGQQNARTDRIVAADKSAASLAAQDYAHSLDALNAYWDRRVRDAASRARGGQVPAVPLAAPGAHGPAPDDLSSAADREPGLARACAVTTLQLVRLQDWVRSEQNAWNSTP